MTNPRHGKLLRFKVSLSFNPATIQLKKICHTAISQQKYCYHIDFHHTIITWLSQGNIMALTEPHYGHHRAITWTSYNHQISISLQYFDHHTADTQPSHRYHTWLIWPSYQYRCSTMTNHRSATSSLDLVLPIDQIVRYEEKKTVYYHSLNVWHKLFEVKTNTIFNLVSVKCQKTRLEYNRPWIPFRGVCL